jgi:hypothetical protein
MIQVTVIEKQEEANSKISRWKKIIKNRMEINEIESKRTKQ